MVRSKCPTDPRDSPKLSQSVDTLAGYQSTQDIPATGKTPALATIWRKIKVSANELETSARVAEPHDNLRLCIEEEDADWYVVCPSDIQSSEEPCSFSNEPSLLAQFSELIHDDGVGQSRCLRCAKDQLPDLSRWIAWQCQDPILMPGNLQSTVNHDLTPQEIDLCKQAILSTVQSCSAQQKRIILITLYCVAASMRDLAVEELSTAVEIGSELLCDEFVNDKPNLAKLGSARDAIDMCPDLLMRTAAGTIAVRDPSLRTFMLHQPTPGFGASHFTMTRICLEQIRRFGAAFLFQPWLCFKEWCNSASKWPLLRYVAQYWFVHYRMTPECGRLDSELYHMVQNALLDHSEGQTSIFVHRKVVDAGYSISKVYRLPGLEAIFRNMGGRANSAASALGKISPYAQRTKMKYSGELRIDEGNLVMLDDDEHEVVIVLMKSLHLDGRDTDEIGTQTSAFTSGVLTPQRRSREVFTDLKPIYETDVQVLHRLGRLSDVDASVGNDWDKISDTEMDLDMAAQ
ncbi:hypothetical protein H2198_007153 [Neophaeococcomyces mojaviensis]|uniref:Uncharacterized protein n=1 Tax=Neophaeococcomyces mojaviensis TaxID=3383035 RepID=A0ACC3A0U8_9EURO|nr:hypothetical protein H2198_007153 [Knufia sp. JES_112]